MILLQYSFSVKAVLASGAEVISASNGFYIDLTPPVFETDVFLYFDVRQGEYLPTFFQGSNDTIKAVWLCTDDKSEIRVRFFYIGICTFIVNKLLLRKSILKKFA